MVEELRSGKLKVPPPLALWDDWQSKGVLFINAIFTFTRAEPGHQFDGHARLWAPLVRSLLEHIVRRPKKPVVFVAWGDKANQAFANSGAKDAAQDAGTWGKSVTLVRRPHPNARASVNGPADELPFLRGTNPFKQVDEALEQIGGDPIKW